MTRATAGESGDGCGTSWGGGDRIGLVVAAVIIFFGSGLANPLMRRYLVHRLEELDGRASGRCGPFPSDGFRWKPVERAW